VKFILKILLVFIIILQTQGAEADKLKNIHKINKQMIKCYGYPRVIYTSYARTDSQIDKELEFIKLNHRRPTHITEQLSVFNKIIFPITEEQYKTWQFPKYTHRFTDLGTACQSKSRGIFYIETDEYHFDEPACLL